MAKYFIKSEQLRELRHYQDIFIRYRDSIDELCREERDDIVYGFNLGQMYNRLHDLWVDMGDFLDDIDNQRIPDSDEISLIGRSVELDGVKYKIVDHFKIDTNTVKIDDDLGSNISLDWSNVTLID